MKKLQIIAFTGILIGLGSCNSDFLDKKPTNQLSTQQIAEAAKTDPSLLDGTVAGIYSTMYAANTSDNFGQKAWDIYSDMLSSDVALGATVYGWYSNLYRYNSTNNPASNDVAQVWAYYYRIIFSANNVIDGLGGTDLDIPNVTSIDKGNRAVMGQAKALRAYAYFYLAHFYATEYGDGSKKILPIYKGVMENQPKSTAAEVYDFMISDLTTAIDYLADFNRSGAQQIDQWVAKGLLAYVYAARGTQADWQKVADLTDDIVNNSGFPLATADALVARFDPPTGNPAVDDFRPMLNYGVAGFNNINTSPNWMWGIDLTTTNFGQNLYAWWGVMDLFTYSYAWAGDPKFIDENLYNAIRPDDIRKNQFTEVSWGTPRLWPINKFCSSFRTKFDDPDEEGAQYLIVDDYVYMRIEEFYLLNAEANAKLGNDAPARDILKTLLQIRIADISYLDALSGQALQDEIYLQTRIELWGEGKSYLAMKRNKASVTRSSESLFLADETFTYNDPQITFVIPQTETLNNPVLDKEN